MSVTQQERELQRSQEEESLSSQRASGVFWSLRRGETKEGLIPAITGIISRLARYLDPEGRIFSLNIFRPDFLTGQDQQLVTGTSGSSGHGAQWDANGDLVTSGAAPVLTGTAAGGSLSGTYPNPNLATDAVDTLTEIASGLKQGDGTKLQTVTTVSTNKVVKADSGGKLVDSVITDNGTNVGVGAASPPQKLTVDGGANSLVQIQGSAAAFLRMYDSGGGTNAKYIDILDDGGGLYIRLLNDDTTVKTSAWTILSSGNVGIGTASPAQALHVNSGRIRLGTVDWAFGTGSPEGAVTANVGSFYSRTDGGAGTSFYVKQSGTGNTGWAAK